MTKVKDHINLLFDDGSIYSYGTERLTDMINHLHNIDLLRTGMSCPASTYILIAVEDYLSEQSKSFQEMESKKHVSK